MKSLRYLNKYFFKYKWHFTLGIFFIIVTNAFEAYMPRYFGNSVDMLKEWSAKNSDQDLIWVALKAGGYYMLMALISGFFLFLTRQALIIMSRHIEYDMKNEIYNHYQRLSYTFFRKNNTGDLMNRISEDVTKVRMYLGPGVMYSINLFILFVFVIISMIQINGMLTIIVLTPLPIMSIIIYAVASRINKASGVVQSEQSLMSTLVQETFSGIRVVKAYGRQREILSKFDHSADSYMKKNMKLVLINALFMPTIFALVGLSTLLCIYLGGVLKINGDLSIGEILSFIFYVNLLTWPFASIGWVISLTQRAEASQARINSFLDVHPEITNTVFSPLQFEDSIEFVNVSYTYPNSGIQAIKNVSFKLRKGESLGVVGRTGSGKSTILLLLTRQIEPDSGIILIDGVPLPEVNLDAFLTETGVVPQDVFLFSDTIGNNISFGLKHNEVSEEDLIKVTKSAHVYHNIKRFKNGFGTLLGERGVNLSGGQKQRISIARALIRKPKLLIMDDCLSAVDTETEEIILNNINSLSLTAIIVSHRVSSIRHANHIINIEGGTVIEEGSHLELLNNKGGYFKLHEKQSIEELES